MYRILVCDDEGIVREGLKFIIEKAFCGECTTEFAKSGRSAVEQAELFRPDIVFMDIQMPGINGIEAMREIRKLNHNIVFIVLTAYDKFTYAKEAIDLGVLEYLTKPINRDKVCAIIQKAMRVIAERREKVSKELEIKEKLETVIPIIENGFIYSILLQEYDNKELLNYKELLDVEYNEGYMLVIAYGDETKDGNLTNPIGASVKMQKEVTSMREVVRELFPLSILAFIGNKIIAFVPAEARLEYEERVLSIERARSMVRKLEQMMGMKFKVGMGLVYPMDTLVNSYKEAMTALKQSAGKVTHVQDIAVGCEYEEYPIEIEKELFQALEKGNVNEVTIQCGLFMNWLRNTSEVLNNNGKLKIMEFVLRGEQQAYEHGGMVYQLNNRQGYVEELLGCSDYGQLEEWFIEKMKDAGNNILVKQKEKSTSVVKKSVQYIDEHFTKDLSLDDISREMNISPYYYSKIFKDEMGINFVEYLTTKRMDYAKELLGNHAKSIKEVCVQSGYGDPNYFSRIFKKYEGMTPSEYREKNNE